MVAGLPSRGQGAEPPRAERPPPTHPAAWRQTRVPTASHLQMTTFPLPEKKQCYDYIFNSLVCDPAARIISQGMNGEGRRGCVVSVLTPLLAITSPGYSVRGFSAGLASLLK